MIEKEPVTVVLSEKGWIRAIKGHLDRARRPHLQGGRPAEARRAYAQTTDTLLLFATNGRFYTLGADKLPGGRGHGEPFRLMIDIEETADAVELFVHAARPQAARREHERPRLHRAGGRGARPDAQGQAGAERRRRR